MELSIQVIKVRIVLEVELLIQVIKVRIVIEVERSNSHVLPVASFYLMFKIQESFVHRPEHDYEQASQRYTTPAQILHCIFLEFLQR